MTAHDAEERAREIAAFEALKPQLAELWREVFPQDDAHYTSVVVPSVSLPRRELLRLPGALFFEEILLFFLIRLRNPHARLVYVTSQPIHPLVLDYYFQFLGGIPGSHARERLTLLCARDLSPRPLTQKVLERPRLVERIRQAIPDLSRAYLTVFHSTHLERRLAIRLGIPINGADPRDARYGTRSGGRGVIREAGIPLTEGVEQLRDDHDLLEAVGEMRRRCPDLERVAVKAEHNLQGEGNASLPLPPPGDHVDEGLLRSLEPTLAGEGWDAFLERFGRLGGIVEEVPGTAAATPSVQLRINPVGQVVVTSTHEEARSGPARLGSGHCIFPAHDFYRRQLQEAGRRVAETMARHGVASRLSIDFVATRADDDGWLLRASELNLGVGGTTHPLLAVRFLEGGHLDPESGIFYAPSGSPRAYRATDSLQSGRYRGLLPEDLIDILTLNQLHYSHASESGSLFHMMGALSEYGRVGLVAIGRSVAEADAVYQRTVGVLDRETRPGGYSK